MNEKEMLETVQLLKSEIKQLKKELKTLKTQQKKQARLHHDEFMYLIGNFEYKQDLLKRKIEQSTEEDFEELDRRIFNLEKEAIKYDH